MGRLRVPRTSQPQQPVGIDWGNPITRGLVVCYDGSNYRDVLANKSYAGRVSLSGGSPSVYYGNTGKVLYRGDSYSSGVNQEPYPRYPTSSSNITLFSLVAATSVAETQYCTTSQTVGGVSATIAIGNGSTSVIRGRMYLSGTKYFGGTFSTSDSVTARKLAIVHRQGVSQTLWVDGAADPIVGSYTGSVISHQYFGSYVTAPYSKEWLSLVWNRALSDAEIKSLSDNPWQIFQPLARNVFSEVAAGGGTHATSGALTGPGASVAGTAAHTAKHATSGALTGQIGSVAGTAARTRAHPSSGALTGQGSAVAGTAARSTPGGSHATSGALTGQGSTIAGTAAHKAKHATSGSLSGQGSLVAGTAARVAAAVTHATSGTLTGPGAIVSGSAQNGAVAPPSVGGSGGTGGSARVRNRKELDDLLTKALKKPTEVAVQLLLPTSPSPEAVAAVISALETRDAETNKSAARQAQSLLARLQVLEREAEDEEAAVIALLLD